MDRSRERLSNGYTGIGRGEPSAQVVGAIQGQGPIIAGDGECNSARDK
jgi:hypothetical protein